MLGKSRDLHEEHAPRTIRQRIGNPRGESPLGDFMLGGVDGVVTTFAVVAGSAGGQLSATTVIILGFANLLADGFSMAVSNYLGTKTRLEEVRRSRADEEWQIREFPEGEEREIREIFAQKGFEDETLEEIVRVITADRRVWVDTMMAEELQMSDVSARPFRAGLTTFVAFSLCGLIPLLPFLFGFADFDTTFIVSAILGAVTFFTLGTIKGLTVGTSPLRSGLRTFAIGSVAAALAYVAGHLLHAWLAG
ncbi:VIT1/CCC1 transporter family protein [Aurantiacibacter sp. MUD11]|uniref:VIT1/CCC1 transporter family protein n=1 Tax=Aurantiacibacter sp. MUD11 TaxID=3003265 RepID=UPI0022AB3B5A|nr:VIT1/CCC1 transporter family protein [Aurantiacibacter sp. MUD11]WAT16879.1 VIT1/CCC1 transporter family protein [Aurantiacibacter sp. MUD11]